MTMAVSPSRRHRLVTVALRTVTPAFTGGPVAGTCEARPSALKGLLRFHYRALGLGSAEDEQQVFGGAGSGQGVLSVLLPRQRVATLSAGRWDAAIGYLGYGVLERNRQTKRFEPVRPFIPAGRALIFELLFHPRASEDQINAVLRSLWGLCHFGGLGSRSRRGWGSVVLTDVREKGATVPGWVTAPRSATDLGQHLGNVLRGLTLSRALPRYTAFSVESRVMVGEVSGDWQAALRWVGGELQRFRSYWRKPPRFPGDRDAVLSFLEGRGLAAAPVRAVFGLPHNYFFKQRSDAGTYPEKAQVAARVRREDHFEDIGRRASPLLIHVHPLGRQSHAVVATFLPAELLPEGAEIVAKAESREENRSQWSSLPADASARAPGDFSPVIEFLDHLKKLGAVPVNLAPAGSPSPSGPVPSI